MDPTIISVLSAILTGVIAYVGARVGVAKELGALHAQVEQLSLRVEKHNSVMERTAALEERVRWMEEELRHRD